MRGLCFGAARSKPRRQEGANLLNILSDVFVFGNEKFGLCWDTSHPYLSVFGLEIYLYAIVIVFGMCMAIITAGLYFKKRGYDPYDITIYALAVIPLGVLGARAYVYIFPWSNTYTPDWSTFFDFRSGGLGIYGGVILGYLAAMVMAKIKKQDFRIVADSIMPGLFLAQSLGRWGNFFNQEAYGNLITNDYNALPNFFEWLNHGPRHGFNGYAVWIGGETGGWYQATFFYESVCTFLGFLVCVLLLTRSKHYKLGWCSAFYGIYYGIVRLVIEGFRSDSLYLYVGHIETDIKISQLVSVFAILFGVLTLCKIYRKELHALYKKMFKDDLDELSKSRWILLAVSVVFLGIGVAMCVLSATTKSVSGKGGESYLIAGVISLALCVYSALVVWSLFDRIKLYCKSCRQNNVPAENWQSPYEKTLTQVICYGAAIALLLGFGLFSLVRWGIIGGIPNGTVLFVLCLLCIAAIAVWKFAPSIKTLLKLAETRGATRAKCDCGAEYDCNLNKFLLFLFPPKTYLDYGVEHLKPYVDHDKGKRAAKKKSAPTEAPSQDDTESHSDD